MTETPDTQSNPWAQLPESAPYVLPEDLVVLERSSQRALANLVFVGSPGPFIGNPMTARVLLLGLNPGFDEGDFDAANNPAIQQPWLKALRLGEDAIFHPIHPDLLRAGGSLWWPRKLRVLVDAVGADAVMTGLACVEWFPYPSRKFVQPTEVLPSQRFTFAIVRAALKRGVPVIIMRSGALWVKSVSELAEPGVITLRNWQNPTISPGNMDTSEWRRVLAAFRA